MTEAAFFEPRKISPTGIGVVIAFHAGLITVAALSKIEVMRPPIVPTIVDFIPNPPDPPRNVDPPKAKNEDAVKTPTFIDKPDTVVATSFNLDRTVIPTDLGSIDTDFGADIELSKPPPDPIRIDAQFDPRYGDALKPPYPLSEQRGGIEGTVTLRVLIGPDGRVKAVEKLAATTDGFFRAAERQALSRWRFKPATVDGRPIESRKVMTLRFELDEDA